MSKLNIDQKTIKELFEHKKADFLIPDYQRPYAWGEEECDTLWEDIFLFTIPNNNPDNFDSNNDEYFLGPVVTFKNEKEKQEIIDGQQRLTTLMLLLRAFYEKFGNMQDDKSKITRENIEKCLWKTNEFGKPDKEKLKIDSEVATDEKKEEFLSILKTGEVKNGQRSNYAKNYLFFQKKINEFLNDFPSYFSYLPTRILNNCILLPIEAESQDTALTIFSTLNDRGKPLSDADIFKAQFYKFFSSINKKESFINEWRELDKKCESIFKSSSGTAMDEIFTRYMYYERAKQGIKTSTTAGLRKFYEQEKYKLLKSEQTFKNLQILADFWCDIYHQNDEVFSSEILKKLFILNYAPNNMWSYFISVYFMSNKKENNQLKEEEFSLFLDKMIAFIWAYTIVNPGVNALRTPIYTEMINLVNKKPVNFVGFKLNFLTVKKSIENFNFYNGRPITKAMLTWWAFFNKEQELISLENSLEIEHIYAKKRHENENRLLDKRNLEVLGNKSLLEKRINIRVSDYRFEDKIKYYRGYKNAKNQYKEGTKIRELYNFPELYSDFKETDIINRNKRIINAFVTYLIEQDLIEEEF